VAAQGHTGLCCNPSNSRNRGGRLRIASTFWRTRQERFPAPVSTTSFARAGRTAVPARARGGDGALTEGWASHPAAAPVNWRSRPRHHVTGSGGSCMPIGYGFP